MNGNWARTEHIRGKGSAANCMLCGRKPYILEKGYCDGSHCFYICCPHCWNKHFEDKRKTGVDITVVAENVYDAISDWNKINARPKVMDKAERMNSLGTCIDFVYVQWKEYVRHNETKNNLGVIYRDIWLFLTELEQYRGGKQP